MASGWNFPCRTSWTQAILPQCPFQNSPKKSGVAVCWQASSQLQLQTWGANGQLDGLLAAGIAGAAASCLQPCRSCGYALGLHSQRKTRILMENFLEDWNYSCTSVLPWKRYYVLKLWNIVGGQSALCLPKIQEHLKWLYLGQQRITGLKEPSTIFSSCAENTGAGLCQRQ